MRIFKQMIPLFIAVSLLIVVSPNVQAQPPAYGKPVPELDVFDGIMQSYMQDNAIYAGVLGIMKDHKIVYMRSFGWKDQARTVFLPENAIQRIASVNKPFTAAAIRYLINHDMIRLDQRVFALDPTQDGILDYHPYDGGSWDAGFEFMTVEHLLKHEGGWDRNVTDDVTYREIEIALDYGFDPYRVPTRRETVEWIMSHPLNFFPGTDEEYANAGFLILGLIVEQVSGADLHSFWREFILPKELWFPTSEFELGRTFAADQNPREPWYHSSITAFNVFDPWGPIVYRPYGGWNNEARIGQGGLISGVVPLLHLADLFYTKGDSIGVRLNGRQVTNNHDGRNYGCEAIVRQRSDGINYAILLNKRAAETMYVRELKPLIDGAIEAGGFTWPTEEVDGVWFDFEHYSDAQGCYDEPYNSFTDLQHVLPYSKVLLKASTSSWTGTITRGDIIMTAPEGSAVIGQ